MSKEITLNISERFEVAKILNAAKVSDLAILAHFLDDMKNVAISPEEWVLAELTKSPTDEQVATLTPAERVNINQTWNWKDNAEADKVINFASATIDALTQAIKDKENAKEITMADKALITLKAKLSA